MTITQRRLYAAIIRLHPADFRNRFGPEMLLDFEDASATHHPVNLHLDALQSMMRQWASQLLPPTPESLSTQAALLTGQYASLAQPNPSAFELLRASCIATLIFFSIGFAAAPDLGAGQIANAGTHPTPTPSAIRSVQHPAQQGRNAGAVGSTIATFGAPIKSEEAEPDTRPNYGFDLTPAVAYLVLLCLYFAFRSYLRKPQVLRTVLVTAILLAIAAPMHAQTKQAALSFDVVSVKPSDPAKQHLALYWRQPDGLKWDGVPLSVMIANAYGVSPIVKGQLEGGPAWMGSQAFDINAKVDAETTARWSKMTQHAVDEERGSMIRSLLTDRFHLKFHHETREMPALALRVAKGGSKLQHPKPEHDLQVGVPVSRINFLGHGHWEGHSALMSNLARSLASQPEIAGRPVIDKTGLTGGYDFTLRWAPDDSTPADPNAQWPSLFTAINEQLGLRLTPEKQPIDIIVVDSVEMPSEN
jgi:uncharacterized protein (TIGR03435 family)